MQVYFTVDCQKTNHGGGLADQTSTYQMLRRLGLSLGYTYLHTPMISPSRIFPVQNQVWKKRSLSWLLSIWCQVCLKYYRAISPNIYDFMGLNSYFTQDKSLPNCRDFPKNRRRKIDLSDPLLRKNDIASLGALKGYIKLFTAHKKEDSLPLLLVFTIPRKRRRLKPIAQSIPHSIDSLDWRAIYLQQRKKHPLKSGFREERLKILAHLRLGDRAAFSTPWGTWVMKSHDLMKGWRHALAENHFPQITSIDFYRFMQGLLRQLPRELYDTQIFSDGFKRTVQTMVNKRQKIQTISPPSTTSLSPSEWPLLKKYLRHQQRLLKPLYDNIPNSTCHIGEKQHQLFRFIAASLEADVAITATPLQHHLLCFLLSMYRTKTQPPPLLILLHKKIDQRYQQKKTVLSPTWSSGCTALAMNTVHVDINAPDFPALAQRVTDHWNSSKSM